MYCANCGTQLVQGLSYYNRCGLNLREGTETKGPISAFLLAITLIGVIGLGIMLGGAVTLRKEAGLSQGLIGTFMFFVFLIVSMIEIMLVRNLSKLTGSSETKNRTVLPPPVYPDLRLPQASTPGEPIPSVTENTTRTLEYARRDR